MKTLSVYSKYLKFLYSQHLAFKFKYSVETFFWQNEIQNYIDWHNGHKKEHFGAPCPTEEQKIRTQNLKDSAILTFQKLQTGPKYLSDLQIGKRSFAGLKVLDIGSGPVSGALSFEECEIYCLDPLFDKYLSVGFPLHYHDRTKFIQAFSEKIPLEDHSIDAVIAVNSIDHVDNFKKTANEIKRVLKNDGKFAMHVHYHKKTKTEPLELSDQVFSEAYSWVNNLKKIKETNEKAGWKLNSPNESYALWKNF
jgi:ubiquinone/menaquinone biosynthesis C-methylase UbiE